MKHVHQLSGSMLKASLEKAERAKVSNTDYFPPGPFRLETSVSAPDSAEQEKQELSSTSVIRTPEKRARDTIQEYQDIPST